PIVQPIDPAAEFVLRGDDNLGRRRRRRRPQIRDEVGNRDVGLVSDCGNDWNGRLRDGARHGLFVERPQIFNRPAAAADDDDVDARHASDRPQAAGNFVRRAFTLDARRPDDQMRVRISPAEHFDDVADGGALERGHDADFAGQGGERPFAGLVEQPFVLKPLLQLIEGKLQRAQALRLQVLADQLVFALWLVDRDTPAGDHRKAVGRLELQISERRLENDGAYLSGGVFQREVEVAGLPDVAVGELALDPDLDEFALEQIADANGE